MSDRAKPEKKTKSGSEKRERQAVLGFRATPAEREEIEARAAKAGLTVSGYLRALAFGKDTPQPQAARRVKLSADMQELKELRYELRKIGGNINQIAHQMNRGEEPPPAIINTALAEHVAAVRLILAALSGETP